MNSLVRRATNARCPSQSGTSESGQCTEGCSAQCVVNTKHHHFLVVDAGHLVTA